MNNMVADSDHFIAQRRPGRHSTTTPRSIFDQGFNLHHGYDASMLSATYTTSLMYKKNMNDNITMKCHQF